MFLPTPLTVACSNHHPPAVLLPTEVYDTEGRFVPQKFEDLFAKFDSGNKGGLSWDDIQRMILANMNIIDPTGW